MSLDKLVEVFDTFGEREEPSSQCLENYLSSIPIAEACL